MIGKTNATTIIGGTTQKEHKIEWIDVDGTLLKTEYVNTGESGTPPSNPSYDNTYLTFNNWNLPYTNIQHNMVIGATYMTVNGRTYFKCTFNAITGLQPTFYVNKRYTAGTLTIDWGDGEISSITAQGNVTVTKPNAYISAGDYVIQIYGADWQGNISTQLFGTGSYRNCIKNAYFGSECYNLRDNVFPNTSISVISYHPSTYVIMSFPYSCYNLIGLVIPSNYTTFNNGIYGCHRLKYLSLPVATTLSNFSCSSNTSLTSLIFQDGIINTPINFILSNLFNIEYLYIPSSVTTIQTINSAYKLSKLKWNITKSSNSSSMSKLYSLNSVSLSNFTSFTSNQFQNSLFDVTEMPTSLGTGTTTIPTSLFADCNNIKTAMVLPNNSTTIGDYAFYNCYNIPSIDHPSTTTSIGTNAYQNCFACLKYIFRSTTPPTLAHTNAFTGINPFAKIYVPDASLTAYKTATNWVTYADYIYPLSDIGE